MFGKIARFLWGDLSGQEIKKFSILTLTFFFIIGSYWTLKPLRDTCFMKIVGKSYLPYAQILSSLIFFILIMLYAKLVDVFQKDKLFYILCTVFIIFFLSCASALKNPLMGLDNLIASPFRILGWVIYVSIDSFGVLITSLFWSFVSSVTDSQSAKKGYALILGGSQFGSILGPTLNTKASFLGIPFLIYIACSGVILVMVMIAIFTKLGFAYSIEHLEYTQEKKTTGIFEGVKLIFSKPYILGVLVVSTFYELVSVVIEYQLLYISESVYKTPEKITEFLGLVGQCTNFLPLVIGLLGVSLIVRKFGITFGLVIYPIILTLLIINIFVNPSLWALFWVVVIAKGLAYSLNNTCKEILYIPTSKDIKYKAKSWIDGFGNRSIKAFGGSVNAVLGQFSNFLFFGAIFSLAVISFWIPVAILVGLKESRLVKEGKIIE